MSAKQIGTVEFFLVWVLLSCAMPAWSHPHAPSVEDALLTAGDFEQRLGALVEHLKTEESQDAQCELGSEMGRIAWENRAVLPHLKDETLKQVVSLTTGPTREGSIKCLTSWAANVLGMIGPRAKSAIPALEKALAEAEAAEAKREKTGWDGINSHRRLDEVIRSALKAIDGKQK
jgi:hypothetical protein